MSPLPHLLLLLLLPWHVAGRLTLVLAWLSFFPDKLLLGCCIGRVPRLPIPPACLPQVTGMAVLMLVLGAALLLWSHIIWLVLLLLSMWRFYSFKVKIVHPGSSTSSTTAHQHSSSSLAGSGASAHDSNTPVAADALTTPPPPSAALPEPGDRRKPAAAGGGPDSCIVDIQGS